MADRSDDLIPILEELGVDIHKTVGDEINGRCPVHAKYKGRESSRNSWYMNMDTGLWRCFTCSARGNLPHLVAELSGDTSQIVHVNTVLAQKGFERLTRGEEEEERVTVDWKLYASFEPLPERILIERRIAPEVAKRYGIRWNPDHKSVVLPILSSEGELLGWQEKKKGWVQNYPEGGHKSVALFGLERAQHPIALVLESPLDVARFHTVLDWDVSAVASFGANMSKTQLNLLEERFQGLILALDNDSAGEYETRRLMGKGAKKATAKRQINLTDVRFWDYRVTPNVKDLGDMSSAQIHLGMNNLSRLVP